MMIDPIINNLFTTNAVRVSSPKEPFWYASGMIGPFYINTHFLLKDEIEAARLLSIIETASSSDRLGFPTLILEHLLKCYNESEAFAQVTDEIVKRAKTLHFDFISGGERRDYFFSVLPAYFLKKPHLFIYKDFQAVYADFDMKQADLINEVDLTDKKALHIADLVTEASSYERVWLPVIREAGALISDTIAVVDRKQGGRDILNKEGVQLHTLTAIDTNLFKVALDSGRINHDQFKMIIDYMADPQKYVIDFFKNNPEYIKSQIALGGKAKERAELALSKGLATVDLCPND